MKNFFLAATFIVALASAAFADGKNSNAKLLSDLKTSLKGVDESAWVTGDSYKRTSFLFNGKSATVYLNAQTSDLIGFSLTVKEDALPEGTMNNLGKKYQGWSIINPIMFIDASGNVAYYVQANKGKYSLALKISAKGRPVIIERIVQ